MLKGNPIWTVAVKSHLASQELQLSMPLSLQKCTNVYVYSLVQKKTRLMELRHLSLPVLSDSMKKSPFAD